jgi:hypothetical protein
VGIFNVDEKTWQRVKDAFRPERLKQLERHWQVDPLSPDKVHGGESLLYAINGAYIDLVKRFRLIREGMPDMYKEDNKRLDRAHQRVFYHELIRHIGELGHFVGDMMMPLHATGLFDYPLAGPSQKRIHRFIEVEVMNPRINRSILEQSRKMPHRALDTVNSDTLQSYVMGYIQNSYKTIFQLVGAQRSVMDDKQLNQNAKYYEAALKRKFLPILKPQVLEAQRVMASLVHSAWKEAGEPTLKNYQVRTNLRTSP